MTALSVNPPYPIFCDTDGSPLNSGYVWLGIANLAPLTNPVAAFWDAALTQPAAQPVRTSGGYPVNNGTPARLYVNSDFSILVKDSRGRTVYSAPTCTDRYSDVVVTGVNATNVGFTQQGVGAVATTVAAKLYQFVSITDFGAVSGEDSTVAIQAALDSGAEEVYVPEGTFNYSAQLEISTKLRLYGPGTLNETILQDAGILVDGVDGVRIEQLTFTGPENLVDWLAGGAAYRQEFKAFIKFENCNDGLVRDVISSGKRGTVWTYLSERMQIENIRHAGFLGAVTTPPVVDSNWYFVVLIQGGQECNVVNSYGSSVGNVVLIGIDASDNMISNTTGAQIHDALIYNSSGDRSTFLGGAVDACTVGLIIRGSSHVVMGYTVKGSRAVGIALTGNGAADAYGANGHGTVCMGNTVVDTVSGHAIQTSAQDLLLPRDFLIINNTVENHAAPDPLFSAISIAAVRGVKIDGNVISKTTANIAIEVAGTSGAEIDNCSISRNSIFNAPLGIRIQYVDNSVLEGNLFQDISGGSAISAHLSDTNFITGNVVEGSAIINVSSVDPCINNTVTNNRLASYGSLTVDRTANITAPPIEYESNTWTPTYATTVTPFGSVTYNAETQGFYTKIGQMVFFSGFLRTEAITVGGAAGDVVIGGLPFACSNSGSGVRNAVPVTFMTNFAAGYPSTSFIQRNESFIRLMTRAASNGDDVPLAISDLGTGATANLLAFSGAYMTDS